MVQFAKFDYPVLADIPYVSPTLIVIFFFLYASRNTYSHKLIVAPLGCLHIGGALLDFP
jgi:hypothetical protein